MITDYISHMTLSDWILYTEFIINTIVSMSWSWASLTIARQSSNMFIRGEMNLPLTDKTILIPFMVWRWRVAFWMISKSMFFLLLTLTTVIFDPPRDYLPFSYHIISQIFVLAFTFCHTYAWWGWRNLPKSPAGHLGVR